MTINLTTLRGTPAYGAGKFGNALTAGVLGTTNSTAWNSAVGTIEAWVKFTGTATRVAIGNNHTASNGVWLGTQEGKVSCGLIGSIGPTGTTLINDGAWHHIALTFDGTNAKVWADGTLQGTTAYTTGLTMGSGTNAIGGFGATTGYDWTGGGIDEVRISSVVRYTAAFTPSAAAFTSDASTTSLYHLEADGTDSAVVSGVPTANAGPDQSVNTGATVTLNGAGSTDPQSDPLTYAWTQTSGTAVTLSSATAASPTFTAPATASTLVFSLTVSDGTNTSAADAVTITVAAVAPTFTPDNTGLIWSPYNWHVTTARAKAINPGAYLRFAVAGATSVALNVDMTANSTPYPILKYRVDSGSWVTVTLTGTTTSVPLTIPAGNSWTKHTFEVVVASTSEFVTRWDPQNAHVSITGISASGGTLVPIQKDTLTGLMLGDSITEGYKNAKNVTTPDGSDATVVWSYLVRQHLGAEIGVVGFGGQSWNGFGQGGVPSLPTAYKSLWAGQARSFAPAPDFVVVNMGANGSVTAAEVTTWLTEILALLPTSKILVLRPFGGQNAAAIQQGVTAAANTRATYVNTSGWWTEADAPDALHPWGYSSITDLAPRAAAAIKNVTGGTSGNVFINKGGVAVAIGSRTKV